MAVRATVKQVHVLQLRCWVVTGTCRALASKYGEAHAAGGVAKGARLRKGCRTVPVAGIACMCCAAARAGP